MTRELVGTDSAEEYRRKAVAFVWGDRVGLFVFLATLCLFGLAWRTAFAINDSYTIANGLYAIEQGSLDMTTAAYGPGLETPGANHYDGELFSRNYGVIFAALPLVYLLKALELVADLRIVLVALWCLTVLAAVLLAGRILDQRRYANYGGSLAVLGLFTANVAIATPLDPPQHHLIALQIVHMVGAAFVGVFTYRLVTEVHDRRRALMATVLVTLGTPLAFWAAVPKRHVLTAAVALGVAFAIALSRDEDRPYGTMARSLAYALVGLLAWIHAPEALILLVALVVVDVPTAPSNDVRTLAIVGGVFLVSLLPMLATNMAITGNPLKVPRSLRSVSSGTDLSLGDGFDSGGSSDTGGSSGSGSTTESGGSSDSSGGGGSLFSSLRALVFFGIALFQSAIEPITTLTRLLSKGISKFSDQPEQVYHALIRSGYVERVARGANDAPAANLSLLESAPVIAGLVAFAPLTWATFREYLGTRRFVRRISAVDAFVVVLTISYSLVYIARLPIHAQVTVRYLFPLYPLAVYGLVRLPSVGGVLTEHWRTFAWAYACSLLIGGQLLLVTLVLLAPGRGEAFQFHALLALATAGLVGVWSVTGRTNGRWGRFGAASIAIATAAATTFVLFVSLEYYSLGDSHALPMVRVLAERISIA